VAPVVGGLVLGKHGPGVLGGVAGSLALYSALPLLAGLLQTQDALDNALDLEKKTL